MATELSTLMHNQLGEPLAHFLSTQGENLAASERAVTVALPTIVLTILKFDHTQICEWQSRPSHRIVQSSNG